jgi:hypothetical protein
MRIIPAQLVCALEFAEGFNKPAFMSKQKTKAAMSIGKIGLEPRGFTVLDDCLTHFALIF